MRQQRRLGRRGAPGPDGAQHSRDQGHRRFADLPRRPLSGPPTATACRSTTSISCRLPASTSIRPAPGLTYIDHLTHNVHRGRMDEWAGFYERLFNFREIRYFDIEGKLTGLKSKAMTSPCGKIRIPINESADDKSQIQEYLVDYRGEGIQHVALGTDDIYATVETLRARGVAFQDTPDTYYEALPHAAARPSRGHGAPRAEPHPDRRRAGQRRDAAADLHRDGDRSDFLRDHPAQGQRGLRRRQLPRAFRID